MYKANSYKEQVYIAPYQGVPRSSSLDQYVGNMPPGYQDPDEAAALWASFEANLSGILANLTAQAQAQAQINPEVDKFLDIYFTVGRFNPLHPGHITLMFVMIDTAISSGNPYKIIIYAGSGPKNNNKTLEKDAILNILNNPISFLEKKAIIEAILILKYTQNFVSDYIEIIEMGFVPKQLSEVMLEIHASNSGITISSFRTAGDKPTEQEGVDDYDKSNYVEAYLRKFAEENNITYISGGLRIPAANAGAGSEAASATTVRLDALHMSRAVFINTYLPAYEGLFEGIIDIRGKLEQIIGGIYDGINSVRDREFTYKINKDKVGTSNISQANISKYIDSRGKNAMPEAETGEKAAETATSKAVTAAKVTAAPAVAAPVKAAKGKGKAVEAVTGKAPIDRITETAEVPGKKTRTYAGPDAGGSRKRKRQTTRKRKFRKRKRQTKHRKSKRRRTR